MKCRFELLHVMTVQRMHRGNTMSSSSGTLALSSSWPGVGSVSARRAMALPFPLAELG